MLKEIIVVEGYHDAAAVKAAVAAEVIVTSGFAISAKTFALISSARQRCGVIILTDPDFAGETIRRRIDARVPGCFHAFLSRQEGLKNGNIGIENAAPEAICRALAQARLRDPGAELFTLADMLENNLNGCTRSGLRRKALGRILGIGEASAAVFLQRLNAFSITREEFFRGLAQIGEVQD